MTIADNILLTLSILFTIKTLDNMLTTGKTILAQRNKPILAALAATLSQIIFYKLINEISSSDNETALYVVSVASGVGTFLALKLGDKFSKERTFVNVILSDDKEAMIELLKFLRENHITNLATDGYTKDWQKTIAITAYAETKAQSRLIDEYIRCSDKKFKRIVQPK